MGNAECQVFWKEPSSLPSLPGLGFLWGQTGFVPDFTVPTPQDPTLQASHVSPQKACLLWHL